MKSPSRAGLVAGFAFWLLLGLGGCGNANPNLFDNGNPLPSGGSPAGGSAAAGAPASAGMDLNIGGSSVAGGTAGSGGNGGSGAGCAFSCGDGGRGNAGSGGSSGDSGSAGITAQAGSDSEPNECSALAPGAKYLPSTQHCYVVDKELRTFSAAQAYCKTLKAHLVTLSNEAENDFAWSLLEEEHWIGSQDGKSPKQSGVGTYTWVTAEPFDYTNWSSEQPNASATDCVESSGGAGCYEHCAFQWTGGEHDGQWNDRYCMHTIASICEWDSAPAP